MNVSKIFLKFELEDQILSIPSTAMLLIQYLMSQTSNLERYISYRRDPCTIHTCSNKNTIPLEYTEFNMGQKEKAVLKWVAGERIDLLDPLSDVYCPALIVQVVYNKLNYVGDIKMVRIHYLGTLTRQSKRRRVINAAPFFNSQYT